MIIMSSNLLAEKPYSKYCKTARLEFEFRKLRFLELIRAEAPEIMLLQEVDPTWREALISNFLSFFSCKHFSFFSKNVYQSCKQIRNRVEKVYRDFFRVIQ